MNANDRVAARRGSGRSVARGASNQPLGSSFRAASISAGVTSNSDDVVPEDVSGHEAAAPRRIRHTTVSFPERAINARNWSRVERQYESWPVSAPPKPILRRLFPPITQLP